MVYLFSYSDNCAIGIRQEYEQWFRMFLIGFECTQRLVGGVLNKSGYISGVEQISTFFLVVK